MPKYRYGDSIDVKSISPERNYKYASGDVSWSPVKAVDEGHHTIVTSTLSRALGLGTGLTKVIKVLLIRKSDFSP